MSVDWIWSPSLHDLVPERHQDKPGDQAVAAYIAELEDILRRNGTDPGDLFDPECEHKVVSLSLVTLLGDGLQSVQCCRCRAQVEKRVW